MMPREVYQSVWIPRRTLAVWVVGLWFGSSSLALAYNPEKIDSDRVRNSIQGNWYDEKNQTFAPPRFKEIQDHPVRKDGRLAGPSWDWQWPNLNLGWLATWVTYSVITIISLILLACLVLLLMHFVRSSTNGAKRSVSKSIEIDLTRVEDLPFSVEQMANDPLAQARRLADSGQYDWAIVYLYGYFLLALDQARKIHLQKGKTNRMYLRELTAAPRLQALVERTMLQFEEVYFGKHSISKADFEMSWGCLDEFHRLLHEQLGNQPADVAEMRTESVLTAEIAS